jgi:hypothetical protein
VIQRASTIKISRVWLHRGNRATFLLNCGASVAVTVPLARLTATGDVWNRFLFSGGWS